MPQPPALRRYWANKKSGKNISDFNGKDLDKFQKGSFVVHKGYGKHGHHGVITKINRDDQGKSKFFDVTYTHGKTQNNTDHDVHAIPRSKVPKHSMDILHEYHPKV